MRYKTKRESREITVHFVVYFVFFLPAYSQEQKLIVLGVAQDAGYPQIGSLNEFKRVEEDRSARRKVVSLGLIDSTPKQKFLLDASPDMPEQLYLLNKFLPTMQTVPDGVFLTHAHIGHYTGLMHFGREAIGAKGVNVYAMPRTQDFLTQHAPWSQLVSLKNVNLIPIKAATEIQLNAALKIRK
jgi:pyrroloquinoline quinone biosynthesis protein B